MSKPDQSETAAPAVGFPVDRPVGRPVPERAAWPWRLLTRADTIRRGDQGLSDDCETWCDVAPIVCGMPYTPGVFLPIRRVMTGCEAPNVCRSRRDGCSGACKTGEPRMTPNAELDHNGRTEMRHCRGCSHPTICDSHGCGRDEAQANKARREKARADALQLQHCAIAVSDWLAGGCDTNDIPHPHIAALVAWTKETTREAAALGSNARLTAPDTAQRKRDE